MATIEPREYTDKGTGKIITRYRVKIRLKGFQPLEATFDRRTDAKAWADKKEYELKYQAQFGVITDKTRTVHQVLLR